jgi:hypothetical protein
MSQCAAAVNFGTHGGRKDLLTSTIKKQTCPGPRTPGGTSHVGIVVMISTATVPFNREQGVRAGGGGVRFS